MTVLWVWADKQKKFQAKSKGVHWPPATPPPTPGATPVDESLKFNASGDRKSQQCSL